MWSGWISLVSLYNVWIIIYRYAFDELHASTIKIWFTLDYTADVFYILDILLGLRTPFLQDGILQREPHKTRKHYMNSTRFYIDCLCLLPLDFLYLSIGLNSLVRIFRTVKVYRIWDFVYRAERIVRRSSLLHISKWVLFNLIFIHWNACLYRCIMNSIGLQNDLRASSGAHPIHQGDNFGLSLNDTAGAQCAFANYLRSLFWSLRCLALLHPLPANADFNAFIHGYFVVEALVGILLLALLYGKINNAIGNYDATQNEFQGQMDEFKSFLIDRKAPEILQRKVISWFDYLWRQSRIPDEQRVFSHLPDSLKAEIAIHVHLNTLKRVDIFQDAEEGFLSELVLRLRPALYSPGDYICRKGQIGRQMFFVTQGKLEVLAADEVNVIATLSAGSYFGEISILNFGSIGNRRTASVRSIGYADLFCLSKEDLWDVLREFPAAKQRLEQVGLSRLQDAKAQLQLSTACSVTIWPEKPKNSGTSDYDCRKQNLTLDTYM
ncbi:unnamed protein product [Schistocephalus solidus]|uniref:Cyclic nucleotide-binding domain-containing protein n=1 Tax=Schistocephalus solidus TaxID=70667 RepID=A0A3P7BXZ1_SCHSO|nr:unnamed protein product [Schistocephalus solidus]